MNTCRWLPLLASALLLACGGGDDDENPEDAAGGTDASELPAPEGSGLLIVTPEGDDALDARLKAQLLSYGERLLGKAPDHRAMPPGSFSDLAAEASQRGAGVVIVLGAESLVADRVAARQPTDDDSFRILIVEHGEWPNTLSTDAPGATFLLLSGETRLARQYAVYEALRMLGVRFYHPEEEFVPLISPPAQLRARARVRTAVSGGRSDDAAVYAPDFFFRGFTFHGAHPLEHLESFSDSAHPIDEAEAVNEWIVKNRGRHFRGTGRGVSPPKRRAQRAEELNALRELLGMSRGSGITLHNQQQGASAAIDPTSEVPVQEQIETLVTQRLENAPDAIEFGIHFGPTELTTTPDQETVQWITWAGDAAKKARPDLPVFINDHTTGHQPSPNYDDQGCPNGTNDDGRIDYYDLAFHTKPDFGVQVHTVMFYPLEGAAPVYNQKSFAHKRCLMEKASAEGRLLRYFPEGSWWLSFDNPIPVYLPLHIRTRHRDVELLKPLLLSRGGGTLHGHKMFNSGHEWGYWQQDYAVGLLHWNTDVTLPQILGELADPFCATVVWPDSCAAKDEAVAVLTELMDHQSELFLERDDYSGRKGGLYPYFAGEDPADDLAAQVGFEFRPVRVPFKTVAAWTDDEVAHFEKTDLTALKESEAAHAGWLARLEAVRADVPAAGLPWFAELVDGVAINHLRAQQTHLLYGAVLAHRAGGDAAAELAKAADTLLAAEAVIRRREKAYRYPPEQTHGGGVTPETAVENGTTYPWRVHTKTHLLTYWHNRHDQASALIAGEDAVDATTLVLDPVFATAGEPLSVAWPSTDGLSGTLTVGEASGDETTTSLTLPDEAAIFAVTAALSVGEQTFDLAGFVVRAAYQGTTPKGGLAITEPDSPVASAVIGSLAPVFRWALVDGAEAAIALAPDPSGDGNLDFRAVQTLPVALSTGDGTFVSEPGDILIPVPSPGDEEAPIALTLLNATLSGGFEGDNTLVGPIAFTGELVLKDIVDALISLAGYDEKGAYATLADILEFDPASPPATVPIHGAFSVAPPGG